jgi:hypothetical protein
MIELILALSISGILILISAIVESDSDEQKKHSYPDRFY